MLEIYEYIRSHPILNIIFLYFIGMIYCIIGTVIIGIIDFLAEGNIFGDGKFIAVLLWPIVLIITIAIAIIFTPIYICSIIYDKITE
jgi:hypothetical protein